MSEHNVTWSAMGAFYDFLMKNSARVEALKQKYAREMEAIKGTRNYRKKNRGRPCAFRTIKRDLERKMPRIWTSIICEDPEDNLVDVDILPVDDDRKVLCESSYVPVMS